MLQAIAAKKCLYCDKTLNGRADKKFCNDYCRNAYNNQLKSANSPIIRNINNALVKNRRILEAMLGEEKITKLQDVKRDLSEDLIKADNSILKVLKKEDLLGLLS